MRRSTALLLLPLLLTTGVLAQTQPASAPSDRQPLKPTLKFPTLAAYEQEIAEPGVLLASDHVWLFAPKSRSREAGIIFKYLTKAYDELYRIVGVHTKYKIVVYHSPKGWGGTSECVIDYDYSNLDLDQSDEWKKHKVPHVSGYVEEMAHNFVGTCHVQFGWEMVGWSLSAKAMQAVAPNPIWVRSVQLTREEQTKTLARYKSAGNTFPADLEANLCDRIHAALLWQCEQKYGAKFWPDFFAEVRKEQARLDDAVHQSGDDNIRNERYRITVECFDRLRGLNFKQLLERNGISTSVDVKSLHPTQPGWNRKFTP